MINVVLFWQGFNHFFNKALSLFKPQAMSSSVFLLQSSCYACTISSHVNSSMVWSNDLQGLPGIC